MSHSFSIRSVTLCVAVWVAIVIVWPGDLAAGDREPAHASDVPYSIVVTGSELLSGVYADGHTLFLTKTFRPLGLRCVGSVSVDDQQRDIRDALDFTLPRSQLVIVTGGLGPTETDITRDVLSSYTGIALEEHPDVLRRMEQRFATPRDRLRANLRRQTQVPSQGKYLPNETGTAVGLVFEWKDKVLVALPGPPRELQPMVRQHLLPYLAERFGVRTTAGSLTVRFVGMGQSQIDQILKDHVPLPNDMMQTSQFEAGRVDFTFSMPGEGEDQSPLLEELRQQIARHLGDHIYAYDATTTLEEAVIRLLAEHHQTIALVEMASSGAVAAGFAPTDANRQVLSGALVAQDIARLWNILELPRKPSGRGDLELRAIARATQQRFQTDWALVVGTPDRNETEKPSQLPILILTPDGNSIHMTAPWNGGSSPNLARFETQVLDLLRRAALRYQSRHSSSGD